MALFDTSVNKNSPARVLSVFSLVMINIIAVDSLRTLPFSAKLGSSLIFFYAVCAIGFFFPVALITAELATTWPKRGGIYVWVAEALGVRLGFLVVWLQWVYNVVWYPTILGLVASVVAYIINPELAHDTRFIVTVVLATFWLATILNCFGMSMSSFISAVGSIFGTLIPMFMIIGLGYAWWSAGHATQIDLSWQAIIPKVDSLGDMVLVTTILFGLVGLEMSAVHAQEVKEPKKDFPRALWISSIVILLSLVCSSLAIAVVVPGEELNLVTGLLQAYEYFFQQFNLPWMMPVVAAFIIIGAIGGISAWIIGPTKGLLAAAGDDNLPDWFNHTNRYGVPVKLLLAQAVIVSGLTMGYLFLPSIESAYLILTELTAILALMMYLLFFVAAIVLRYKQPEVERPYRIPGGALGMWFVAGIGFLTTAFALMLGFIPPSQVDVGNVSTYQLLLLIGVALFCLPAWFIHKKNV